MITRSGIHKTRGSPHKALNRCISGILVLLTSALFGCDAASFDTPFTMYTSIVSTDLNGDGRPDIAMASSYISGSPPHAGNAVVLLQNIPPFEGFLPPRWYETGDDSQSILAGDIDGDGKPDLVVSNSVTSADNVGINSISILQHDPGNPGAFLPAKYLATGQSPAVALGDVDGDGKLDLVVGTTSNPAGIFLFRQSPSNPGTFESPELIASLPGVSALVAGDIDGNGRVDICVATSNGIFVLIQSASVPGSFLPAVGYVAGSQPIAIAFGELNGDGRPDLAVANYGSPDGSIYGSASILLQDPAVPGKYLPATNYATGHRSDSIAIGDLNRDGKPDLAVANSSTLSPGPNGNVSLLFQDPANTGSFLPSVNLPEIFQPLSVSIGDLNGDGGADIAVAAGGAVVYYQDPLRHGIFSAPVRIGP